MNSQLIELNEMNNLLKKECEDKNEIILFERNNYYNVKSQFDLVMSNQKKTNKNLEEKLIIAQVIIIIIIIIIIIML